MPCRVPSLRLTWAACCVTMGTESISQRRPETSVSVARAFGADAFDDALCNSGRRRRRGQIPFTRSAKKVLEPALREALVHKDNEICCEHLLLGILRSGDKAAIGLITEHVYTAQLRAAVVKLLEKAA
jgi:ATP-dependent Clp protease ATP-binding subunit ClpA